jgi:alkanesulfonate monooxygenase SsuD/methylene tetrahydromethanopterin reductase-like flavin-dependent oxidoreductase (luciferase family)
MTTATSAEVKIGALLWPQTDDWASFRDAAIRADRAGVDSLWTWDHLMGINGPWTSPIMEGWATLAGWAAVTRHATIGLMVGANTFRNPGLTAKLAVTIDHISGGRAILGIGGAWFRREHEGYGIEFGRIVGERLDRLDEAVRLIRGLLDGRRIELHEGRFYRMRDALLAPLPVNGHLPILIGGSGPQKTLRTTARYADAWNTDGTPEQLRARDAILRERCAEVGRDPDTIERTATVDVLIRDDAEEARRVWRAARRGQGSSEDDASLFAGTPERVADGLRSTIETGFRHLLVDVMSPYDPETLERLPEVRSLLAGTAARR